MPAEPALAPSAALPPPLPLPPLPPLRLFGVPAWFAPGGASIAFKPERPYQLLAYLACRAGWVSRDELAEWLWPGRAPREARSNLRKVLLLAQRIEGLPPLSQRGELLRWAPDSDLQRFEAAGRERDFDAVLASYRPPLLHGMEPGLPGPAQEWLGFERQRLHGLWRDAAARQLARLADEPAARAALSQTLLAQEPLDETLTVALARAQLALGSPSSALHTLNEHARRLLQDTGLAPSAELRTLAESLRRAPATTSADPAGPPATTAPAWPTPHGFVGRRVESAKLHELLSSPHCRVVTLTGPGGSGKSSLARAALASLATTSAPSHAGQPPGGTQRPSPLRAHRQTRWVALADLEQSAQLPARLAASLALVLQGGADAWQQIEHHLGVQPWLLVLDNAEHLADLSPLLERLLAACPGLQLLHTSRTRLGLAGEWLLPLDGLPLPDSDETEVELLRLCDSVRLFEQRALAAAPGFRLAEHAPDVVRLVHAVQGLPLAIELAAAWVRLLPVREIVAELARSVDLLDDGPARLGDRSLRASFARSWRLLTALEQRCLADLALLPADFSREMAQQVAQSSLPVLAALADKSLLRAEGDGRFSLHPLLRQCAAELAAEPAALQSRHAAYMGRWLARYGDPRGNQVGQLLAEIERELPHARAAWQWALAHQLPEVVAQATLGMLMYFESRGLWQEAIATFQQAVEQLDEQSPAGGRAVSAALRALAPMQYRRGHLVEAEASARRALKLAQRLGEKRFLKVSLNHVGLSLSKRGRYEEALQFFQQALKHARRDGDPYFYPAYSGNIAMTHLALGRMADATEGFREAVALHRAQGNLRGLAIQLFNLGDALQAQFHWAEALAPMAEALRVCEQQGLVVQRSLALLGLGVSQTGMGQLAAAQHSLALALEAVRSSGEQGFECLILRATVQWHLAGGDLAGAHRRVGQALAIAETQPAQLGCLLSHAQWLAAADEACAAASLLAWLIDQTALPGDDRYRARQALAQLALAPEALAACTRRVPADGTLAGVLALARQAQGSLGGLDAVPLSVA